MNALDAVRFFWPLVRLLEAFSAKLRLFGRDVSFWNDSVRAVGAPKAVFNIATFFAAFSAYLMPSARCPSLGFAGRDWVFATATAHQRSAYGPGAASSAERRWATRHELDHPSWISGKTWLKL